MKKLINFFSGILILLVMNSCAPVTTVQPTQTPPVSRSPSITPSAFPKAQPTQSPTLTPQSNLGKNELFHSINVENRLLTDPTSLLHASDNGSVWLKTQQKILFIREDTIEIVLEDIQGDIVGIDQAELIWILNQDGSSISSWGGNGWSTYSQEAGWVPLSEYSTIKSSPITDQFGQLWSATSEDLRFFDGQNWERFTFKDLGFAHPLETDENALPYLYLTFLNKNMELWLGTCNWTGAGPIGGQGVRRYDGVAWQEVSTDLSSGCTKAIAEDSDGRIWIGLDGDVWQYDPKTGIQEKIAAPQSPFGEGSSFGGVESLTLDSENNPWADLLLCGGAGCGFGTILYHFDGEEWIEIIQEDFHYHDLVFDHSGEAWLLSPGGIYNIVENQPELFLELPIIPKSTIKSPNGQVWFLVSRDDVIELWMLDQEITK